MKKHVDLEGGDKPIVMLGLRGMCINKKRIELDRVQRRVLRSILGLPRSVPKKFSQREMGYNL